MRRPGWKRRRPRRPAHRPEPENDHKVATYILLIAILSAGALAALLLGRRAAASAVGALASIAAGACGLISGGTALAGATWDLRLPWSVPMGSFHVAADPLSGFFLCVISLLCGLCGLYGWRYLAHHAGRRNLGASWCFYLLLFASMAVVVTARNAVLFLVAWEAMSLSSLLLVMFEHERPEVVRAGWTYLVATHLGTAFLLVMFLLLADGGSLEFDTLAPAEGAGGAVFLLAMVGFGTKAGFLPLHVWLPEAHPAAPSHVSAVMSGVMIKTGIYGLLRTLLLLGPPPAWWGFALLGVGAASGVFGVLLALAQHDLKRLLAYHSVENIGIIALGMGVGLLGVSSGNHLMAALGFTGALLHVLNHAVFKGLLFLAAGSVLHATATGELDRLGGLLKRMPATGGAFLVGSAAISGLPPLNGFVSEFCMYAGALSAIAAGGAAAWGGVVAAGSLALISGLALACFSKAFGIVFLGEPRSESAEAAHDPPLSMRLPVQLLAGLCVALGLCGPLAAAAAAPAVAGIAGGRAAPAVVELLWWVSGAALLLGALVAALALCRRRLLRGRTVGEGPTWDCGYAAPGARMQYTASSYAMPIVKMFRGVLGTTEHLQRPEGLLPRSASVRTHTGDPLLERAYRPAFAAVAWLAARLRWLQRGRNQLYVLYIALAVLALLVFELGGRP